MSYYELGDVTNFVFAIVINFNLWDILWKREKHHNNEITKKINKEL